MASEASLAEQTTDEQIGESKVIDVAKIVEEEGVSQPKQTAGSDIEKDKVEEPARSETSAADSKEMIENMDEASPTEEVKKEDEDDMASASGVLEDKKEDAPIVDEVKKETEGSAASGSDVLGDDKDVASVVEDVKKESETGKTSSLSDAEVEASIRDPEEKSINTTESLSEGVEKTLLDSSSSSVQESEQVGFEPEVSNPIVEIAKSVEESKDISTNLDLASEAVAKSEEHPVPLTVTERAPDAIGELEGKNEKSEADDVMEASKDENIATVDENIATLDSETVSEPVKEELVVEAGNSESQALDAVPGDSAEVEAKDDGRNSVSENTEKASGDVNASGCPANAKNEESEHNATESLGKGVASLPNPLIAVGETEAVDTTSVTEAAEIIVKPELNIEEQKGEKTVEMELVKEQKDEKTVEEEPDKEQDGEKAVETGSTLTAAKETEASSEEEKRSEGADKVFEQRDLGVLGSATQSTENLEKEKASEVPEQCAEEPKHENENIEANTTLAQTPRDRDQIGPATEVTEASSEEEKLSEAADKVSEQRNLGVSGSATQSTENSRKEKASEVAEQFAGEPKHENENIEANATPALTPGDIDRVGPATEVPEASSEEEKPSEGADKLVEQRELGVSGSASKPTENLEKEKASEVAEAPKHENENIEDDTMLAQSSREIDLGGQANETDTLITESVAKLEAEKSDVDTMEKDETEEKNGTEKSDAQNLVESSKDGADLKTNLNVQKVEASGKPSKTLMSKVKHSIVKVKKAIIGKSLSSKTISAESKDELKVK